jgi:hypothetical protein
MTQATLEFWFRTTNISPINITINMIELRNSNTTLSLGLENGTLACRVLNSRLVYQSLWINTTSWQHVSCSFESEYDLRGVVHSNESQFYNTYIGQTVLPAGNYTLSV